jgi:hypothetical protein
MNDTRPEPGPDLALTQRLRRATDDAAAVAHLPGPAAARRGARRRKAATVAVSAAAVAAFVAAGMLVTQRQPWEAAPVAPASGGSDTTTRPSPRPGIAVAEPEPSPAGGVDDGGARPTGPRSLVTTGSRDGVSWRLYVYPDALPSICSGTVVTLPGDPAVPLDQAGGGEGCGQGAGQQSAADTFDLADGVVPAEVTRVRLLLAGGARAEVATVAKDGYEVRFWVTPVPKARSADHADIRREQWLDADGRVVCDRSWHRNPDDRGC